MKRRQFLAMAALAVTAPVDEFAWAAEPAADAVPKQALDARMRALLDRARAMAAELPPHEQFIAQHAAMAR